MLKSTCSVCGGKKSTIHAKTIIGERIFNTILNKAGEYIGELHLPSEKGEYVPNGSFNNQKTYSYCGSGTKYEQRNREGYQGINELDSMCKLHDQFYNETHDTQIRNISDIALAHRANEIANNPQFDEEQRRFASLVKILMENKARFGLGLNHPKNSKKGPMKRQ